MASLLLSAFNAIHTAAKLGGEKGAYGFMKSDFQLVVPSQTPSISFERDIYRSQPMATRRLRFASDGQLELNVIGVNDAVFVLRCASSGSGGSASSRKSWVLSQCGSAVRTDVSTRLDFIASIGSCASGGWAENTRRPGGSCKIRCASHLLSTSATFTTSMSSHGSDMASTHTIFNWTTNFDRTALACAHAPCQHP